MPGCKNPGIDQVIGVACLKANAFRIEDHDIGSPPRRDRTDRTSKGLCAAGQRFRQDALTGQLTYEACHDVPRAVAKPLAVFELSQLSRSIDLDIEVGADPKPPAGSEVMSAVEMPSPAEPPSVGASLQRHR